MAAQKGTFARRAACKTNSEVLKDEVRDLRSCSFHCDILHASHSANHVQYSDCVRVFKLIPIPYYIFL